MTEACRVVTKGYDTWPDTGPTDAAHLISSCPAMRNRDAPIRQLAGWIFVYGTDVCGWCRRVWIARHEQDR